MFDFLGKYRRLGPGIVVALGVLVGVSTFALTRGDGGGTLQTTNTTSVANQFESTTLIPQTSAPQPTTSMTVERSATSTSVTSTTPPPPTTASPRPLVLSRVSVGVGTPCHDAATTTTTGSGGTPIDGCFFFVYWPDSEANLHLTLLSDRGFSGRTYGPPCQSRNGECYSYHGLGKAERAEGERECFWFTTSDEGWETKSNEVCINWPRRSDGV